MVINLTSFKLEKIDLKNYLHVSFIEYLEKDELIKKYIFPNNDSILDFIPKENNDSIFNSYYIVFKDDKMIGILEIENTKDVYINIAIANEDRGRGYTSMLLDEIKEYLLLNTDINSANLVIKKDNDSSIKATSKSSFVQIEDDDEEYNTYIQKR